MRNHQVDIWSNADLRRNPFMFGQIRIMESFLDVGLQIPLSSFMVTMLNHYGRALAQYIVNSILSFVILDRIGRMEGYSLSLRNVSQYYMLKQTRQWRYSLIRRPGMKIPFLLPNKKDGESIGFEIGGQIIQSQYPLMVFEHNYDPCMHLYFCHFSVIS